MRQQDFTKKEAERLHAQRRLQERYGIALSGKEYKGVIRCITSSTRTNPTATLIERQSQRVSVWLVPFRDTVLKAVFDVNRSEIITFLPHENYTENYNDQLAA